MNNTTITPRFITATILILLTVITRLVPHPANFTPLGAMALFGAAYFSIKHWGILIPLVGFWMSDVLLYFTVYQRYLTDVGWLVSLTVFSSLAMVLIGVLGAFIFKRITFQRVVLGGLMASVLFFTLSNLGVWLTGRIYPLTMSGLITCFAAGVPFFKYTLMSDIAYSAVLFGTFELLQSKYPVLKIVRY